MTRRRPLLSLIAVCVALLFGVVELQLYRSYGDTGRTTEEFARTTDATTALANVQREALTIVAAVATLEEGASLTPVDIRRGLLERQFEVFVGAAGATDRRRAERTALRSVLADFDRQLERLHAGSRARGVATARPAMRRTLADVERRVKRLFDAEEHDLYQALGHTLHQRTGRQRLLVALGGFGLLFAAAAAFFMRRSIRSDFARAYAALAAEVRERKLLQDRLSHQALHDPLTGLANRVLFRDELQQALERPRRHAVAVLYLDLDGFKAVNDGFGHEAGDELLRQAARRLGRGLRQDDRAARLGGDEFGVLLAGVDARADAAAVADRLLAAMAEPFTVCGKHVGIGASIGIELIEPGIVDAEAALRHADLAMYAAKKQSKGTFELFSPEMSAAARERGQIEDELHAALSRDQLELHFQPIVDLESLRPVGLEALLRWRHPERGLLLPGAFLEIAEEAGVMVPFGRWALEESCRQAVAWQGAPLPWVSVNISPRQLREPELVTHVSDALRKTGLDPTRLMLEISELTMLNDQRGAARVLAALRELGVRIALDDFGTGYSSLGYLRFLPIDVLKIDKCFVDQLTDASHGARLAEAILRFGGQLDMLSVAEGVEHPEQLQALRLAGCELAQGYHFSRPVPADAVAALLTPPTARPATRRSA